LDDDATDAPTSAAAAVVVVLPLVGVVFNWFGAPFQLAIHKDPNPFPSPDEHSLEPLFCISLLMN